jgi:hypothetical protein
VVQHGAALDRESRSSAPTEAVVSAEFDRFAGAHGRAVPVRALKLTARPWEMSSGDVDALRRAECSDRDVVDANHVNRVADGLGVELEPEWPASARVPRRYGIGDRGA